MSHIYTDDNVTWFDKAKRVHRSKGPSQIDTNGTVWFHTCGQSNRRTGPAIIHPNGFIVYLTQGVIHRIDGPAFIRSTEVRYIVSNQELSVSEFFLRFGTT